MTEWSIILFVPYALSNRLSNRRLTRSHQMSKL